MENEKNDNLIIVYAEGVKQPKTRISDFIKIGFGFYVGYNLGRILKRIMSNNMKTK